MRSNLEKMYRFAFQILFILCSAQISWVEFFSGTVVGVTDGDTLRVLREGTALRIRLYGVDAPESKQPFGSRAKQFTSELVFGKVVTVETRSTDRYGRIVGNVILGDGRILNQELVRHGFGWWYESFAQREGVLKRLQEEAKAKKRGLWAEEGSVPPWEFRRKLSAKP